MRSPRRGLLAPLAGVIALLAAGTLPPHPASSAAIGLAADVSTIAVVGDFGYNNTAEGRVASLVAGWAPDAVLAVGDDYYATAGGSGTGRYDLTVGKYYCRFLAGAAAGANCPSGGSADTNRFFSSTGNHDYSDGGGATALANYLAYFSFPGNERYYSTRIGAAEVFVIDSDEALRNATEMDAQKTWLQGALAASSARWQIVVFHHPPYSSSSTHGSSIAMRWPFASWGADLVINGHDHTYERVAADGITYVVDGLGGASIYSFGTPVTGSALRYNGDYGALKLAVSDTALTGSFISVGGVLVESFTVGADAPVSNSSVSWSGGTWAVKTSASPVGPGPNRFSGELVRVDADGYLHLRAAQDSSGTWASSEVIAPASYGYGTYTFTLGSRVDALDPRVVLGLFTWSDNPAYANREIDIEFARWAVATDPTNAQYVVQPWDGANHLSRFTQGALAPTTQSFTWAPGRIDWESRDATGALVGSKSYSGTDVPIPGDERVRLNLWLYQGIAPTDGLPAEAIVRSFAYTPPVTPTPTPSPTPSPTPTPSPAPALPGVFAKSAPKNAAKVAAGTISLSWGTSAGAASYEYCLSTSSTCASWTGVATATSVTVSVATKSVTRWWQVRARNAAGTTLANGGTVWKFTTR